MNMCPYSVLQRIRSHIQAHEVYFHCLQSCFSDETLNLGPASITSVVSLINASFFSSNHIVLGEEKFKIATHNAYKSHLRNHFDKITV